MTDLTHAVTFLQNAYTILLALALTEAFKQLVPDNGDRHILWERLPSLLSFLFLIFPFFHGMSRYFYVTYLSKNASLDHFAIFLMIDGIAFMVLSAFFFVMSRSLSPVRWRNYSYVLLLILLVDFFMDRYYDQARNTSNAVAPIKRGAWRSSHQYADDLSRPNRRKNPASSSCHDHVSDHGN